MTVKTGIESCSIKLEHPAEVPDELQLAVTTNGVEVGIPRDLSGMQGWPDGSGWTINAAGDMVELKGRLCDLAKDGTYDKPPSSQLPWT